MKELGCTELKRKGTGSHRKWYNPSTKRMSPIPDWGDKDLKMGTLRNIIKQLGLSWEEFSDRV